MSKLETTKQSLNKMIQSVTTEISEEIRVHAFPFVNVQKKSSNQEKITTLKNKINIMKSKYDTTITVAYLKTKFNTLVFDYIYPWTFTVLGFMDRLQGFFLILIEGIPNLLKKPFIMLRKSNPQNTTQQQ